MQLLSSCNAAAFTGFTKKIEIPIYEQLVATENAIIEKRLPKDRGHIRHKEVSDQIEALDEDIKKLRKRSNEIKREAVIKFALIGEVLTGMYSTFDNATKRMCYELFFESIEFRNSKLKIRLSILAESLIGSSPEKGQYEPNLDRSLSGLKEFFEEKIIFGGEERIRTSDTIAGILP